MSKLQQRLASVLADALATEQEPDGALTVRHDGTLASLRVVAITEGLDLVSLTQILAWELPLTSKLRDAVSEQAGKSQLGTVTLVPRPDAQTAGKAAGTAAGKAAGTADAMLRYNFPGNGLTDDALRTLVLLVLDHGAQIGRALA